MDDLARKEVAATTLVAVAALTTVPPDANAIAHRPTLYAGADVIDAADNLVAGHARQRHAGKHGQLGQHIAVTDTASFNLDSDFTGTGFRREVIAGGAG